MTYYQLWNSIVGNGKNGLLSGNRHAVGKPAAGRDNDGHRVFRVDADKGFDLLDIDWDVSSHVVIEFAPGIGPRQLRLQRADGKGDRVHVLVTLPGKGNKVSLINFATHPGQTFRFANGSSWDGAAIRGAAIRDRAGQAGLEQQRFASGPSEAASGKAGLAALAPNRYAEWIHARLL